MTINLPIETYRRLLKVRDVLDAIVLNARLAGDPTFDFTTDIFTVPVDDIKAAEKILGELRR